MADPTSGDPSARSANGRVEGQQHSSDSAAGTIADPQTLADSDQTLSDEDQTSSDGDQVGGLRLRAADRRDALADSRDDAGRRRDEAAVARAAAMAELDAALEQDSTRVSAGAGAGAGAGAIVRAAGQRRRAAQRRAQAAAYRDLAAHDRRAAAFDREQAAQERLHALADREALVGELRREQERRDEALRHQRHAEKLARTLQRSLSPRLPVIAGLDVFVHYEPFAPEAVGGDFYDLFPLAASRTGFFLGDVCGKGPDAATVTSLARYTMRTAAMLHESPAAILADLNSALLMDSAEPMGCTAVYGQIDMSSDAASIILAVGGHPAPLVVRTDGSVETTPAQGTMLGAVAQPAFRTCEVQLAAGDAIVIYSDGILDAAIDGVRVDERRLRELLSGPSQAVAADLGGRLLGAVRRTDAPLRDDVAFMALRSAPAT